MSSITAASTHNNNNNNSNSNVHNLSIILPSKLNVIESLSIKDFPALNKDGRFKLVDNINNSLFGMVKQAIFLPSNQIVCIKVTDTKLMSTGLVKVSPPTDGMSSLVVQVHEDVQRETAMLSILEKNRPNDIDVQKCLPLHMDQLSVDEHIILGSRNFSRFVGSLQDDTFHYLITEYCHQDIYSILTSLESKQQEQPNNTNIIIINQPTSNQTTDQTVQGVQVPKQASRFSEDVARCYFIQLVQALLYIHSNHIVHLDMSVENICLLQDQQTIKLIDFGLACLHPASPHGENINDYPLCMDYMGPCVHQAHADDPAASCFLCVTKDRGSKSLPGKIRSMSPEIYNPQEPVWNAYANDVYALGTILYVLVTGRPCYQSPDPKTDVWFRVIFSGMWLLPEYTTQPVAQNAYGHLSKEVKDLISHLICPQSVRYTLRDILAHPWLAINNPSALSICTTVLPTASTLINSPSSCSTTSVSSASCTPSIQEGPWSTTSP